jgi:hypothetical protein
MAQDVVIDTSTLINWETNHRFVKKHFKSFAELIP